jgi:DNA-binding NtrC family response regulator
MFRNPLAAQGVIIMPRILIVDDEAAQRSIMASILRAETYEIREAPNVESAIAQIESFAPSVILTDLKMPGSSGMDLVEKVSRMDFPPEIIVLTAYGSIESAVQVMKKGAYDYLTKPLEREELLLVVKRALEKRELRTAGQKFRDHFTRKSTEGLVAESPGMKQVIETSTKVAQSDATVLIRGETGTGKERIAQLIHYKSLRSHRPMASVNCAAFQETLLEGELFGHEKGSFTGANAAKTGIIEDADGSTLFLDEIADMSLSIQAKVLRALQEREIRRVGSTRITPVDIRVIAATNQNIEEKIRNQTFRQDLFYRLNIIPIVIPPLRERIEDIAPLVDFFLSRYGAGKRVSPPAMALMYKYSWPGNVRELQALVQRVCILCNTDTIMPSDLPPEINTATPQSKEYSLPKEGIVFEAWEKNLLNQALERANGTVAEAARLLGMTYRTFQYRAEKFGLMTAKPDIEQSAQ